VRLEPITEQNVVTYTTVMRTENPDLRLRPGMTANVSVQVARRDEVLRIPAAALRFHPPMPAGKGGRGGARGDAGGARADVAPSGGGRRGQGSAMGGSGGGGAGFGGGAPDSARAARWRNRGGATGAMGGGAPGGAMADASGGGPGAGGSQPGRGVRGLRQGSQNEGEEVIPASIDEADAAKPGNVYVLRGGKPEKVAVVTGLTDGTFVEVRSGEIKEGDLVVIGVEQTANRNASQLAPPPGLGGPGGFGGRGGGGGGGRR
jgi:HlyD family secretion protein